MADNDDVLSRFVGVTGVDEERAKFFLESSNWQLETALERFYDSYGEDSHGGVNIQEVSPQSSPAESPKASPKPQAKPRPRFGTIQSLQQQQASSSDEEGQAFYAGGSEHSGHQVLGPPKKKDFVTDMFKFIQEQGAEVVQNSSAGTADGRFTGTGYKLGQTSDDSVAVTTSSTGSEGSSGATDVVLKLWRDGWSLNDEELRSYTDPNNREFLESVRRGEVPSELVRMANGSGIHLTMEDHRQEEFIQLQKKIKPFSGQGHTLGSPAPAAVGTYGEQQDDKEANEKQAKRNVKVDKAQPTTNIQIRLTDGSRLIGEFNHSHTISDIRRYVVAARPQYETRSFVLMTAFPSNELSEEEKTISEAGLLNATVMVRFK